jgi:ABC-2 type transport system permease protein
MSDVRGAAEAANEEPPPIVNAPFRFWVGVVDDARAVYLQRELLRSFVARELRQRYKGSFLGWGWALIRPLVMLLVYGIAVGVFLGAGASIPQFAVYLYTGLIAWAYFSTLVTGSIAAMPGNAGLINKAAFQKELLVAAVVVVAVLDLVIQGSVLVVGYLVYGSWPTPEMLWWILPGFALLTIVGVALGLVLSAANVYFRDVGYLTEVALQVGFWMVPVLYSYAMVEAAIGDRPVLLEIYSANPVVPAVNAFRLALWPSATGDAGAAQLMPVDQTAMYLVAGIVIGLPLLWLGQRYFARVSGNIAQEL